ncbi:unnamed protein product [Schistocephalus solidus]|uniref:Reverse transcriptase domain-containing protein n=1 Tax=Schistocephalus solidus TaxID=70667 RepID=A0A183TSR3_SCHSO|nr:unnamed protein product [Schistocephalus solidus]
MFSAILMDAYRDEQPGIRIAHRTDGHLPKSGCMWAPTRVSTTTLHDLLFADDCARNTVTEEDMQRSMDLFGTGCASFRLTISAAKTVVMHQPPPSAEYNAPRINFNAVVMHQPPPSAEYNAPRINVNGVTTQKRGDLRLSRKHDFAQHENRFGCPTDFQS